MSDTPPIKVIQLTDADMQEGRCEACGHKHTGPAFGFICIGCPCTQTPGADSYGQ